MSEPEPQCECGLPLEPVLFTEAELADLARVYSVGAPRGPVEMLCPLCVTRALLLQLAQERKNWFALIERELINHIDIPIESGARSLESILHEWLSAAQRLVNAAAVVARNGWKAS